VTGAADGLGGLLVERLLAPLPTEAPQVKVKVVAIDTIRGHAPGATWRLADVRDPGIATKLNGVDVLVHLDIDIDLDGDSGGGGAAERHATNVRGTATVLTAAAASGVGHVVLVTSAMVYGAQSTNAVPLPEDAELAATPDTSLVGDLLEMERLAAQAPRTHPGLRVTVLRPAILVGEGVDSVFTRHFEEPRLLAVKGARSCWQFCHVDDLMAALVLVSQAIRPTGATASPDDGLTCAVVGSSGWLEQADVERITGKRHIELPAAVAFGTAERLHRLGLTPASADDLQYLVHPWVVETGRLDALGFAPAYDNEAALRAAMAESTGRTAIGGHRLGRKDAAAGAGAALGATVALVGTAALVRRARRRRRG
jgi:nucleoside-diphosphate-sugar epimerase